MTRYTPPPPRADLKWLAVDFDDTLCRSTWSPENPLAPPGDPIKENVAELRRCVGLGWKIIIHTARSWAEFEIVESWLNHHDIPFKTIVCGKLLAYRMVDDRNAMLGGPWV